MSGILDKAKETFRNLLQSNTETEGGQLDRTSTNDSENGNLMRTKKQIVREPNPTVSNNTFELPTAQATTTNQSAIQYTPPEVESEPVYAKPHEEKTVQTKSNEELKQEAYDKMVADRNDKLQRAQDEENHLNRMQEIAKDHGGLVNYQETEFGTYYQFGDGSGYWIEESEGTHVYPNGYDKNGKIEDQVTSIENNLNKLNSGDMSVKRNLAEQIYDLINPIFN